MTLRVERGRAGPEELAAITAVLLLARAAPVPAPEQGREPAADPAARGASWRRPERVRAYCPPHSWQR